MSAIPLSLFAIVCSVALLVACSDDIPEAQQEQVGPASTQSEHAQQTAIRQTVSERPADPDRPREGSEVYLYSYRHTLAFARVMAKTLDAERLWCEEQPAVAELRARLEVEEPEDIWRSLLIPAAGEDLRAIELIAEATAEARGISLTEMPAVYLVSRTTLRQWACLTEEIWEDPTDEDHDWTVGRPAGRLAMLIGQDVEEYGDLEQSWLSATLAWGWYGEIPDADELEPGQDGPGLVVIVSRPPMPAAFVGVISHELVHFLQDQWTDWRLHDWYRDSQTTDELQALRWVVEGDATLNELYGEDAPLIELLADIEWGPEENSESDLWYRAYDALSPQDSENLFAAYDQGSDVLATLRHERGQEAIDALLLNPPESSEQLIHPEKLEADEQPIELTDLGRLREEVLPASEWEEPIVDRMGEQWLHSLIATASKNPRVASAAASGWGSDEMALWRSQDGETEVVTWQVVFDDPWEHREGVSGLRRWFFSHTANEAEAVYPNVLSWNGPGGAARLITRPNAVWLVVATEPNIADSVASGIRTRFWTNYWAPGS